MFPVSGGADGAAQDPDLFHPALDHAAGREGVGMALATRLVPMKRKTKKPDAKRVARRLRAVSDELGVTVPQTVRRSTAGVKAAPRSRPRTTR